LLTAGVFVTGLELWFFGFRLGDQWLTWHKATFILWFLTATAHLLAYVRRAPALALADSCERLRGAAARRSLVVAGLLLGVVLVVAMLPFSSPFTPIAGGG
jgi:hypothetical protein